jgi:hypothetical protein
LLNLNVDLSDVPMVVVSCIVLHNLIKTGCILL